MYIQNTMFIAVKEGVECELKWEQLPLDARLLILQHRTDLRKKQLVCEIKDKIFNCIDVFYANQCDRYVLTHEERKKSRDARTKLQSYDGQTSDDEKLCKAFYNELSNFTQVVASIPSMANWTYEGPMSTSSFKFLLKLYECN